MKTPSLVVLSMVIAAGLGCGCGDDAQEAFPNSSPGDLNVQSIDWVVDGMECDGEETPRMISLQEAEDGEDAVEQTVYRRGDDCVDTGDVFWPRWPESDGDDVSVLVDSRADTRVSWKVEAAGDYAFRLIDGDGRGDLLARQVHPDTNPSPIPDLSDFDLAGQWWMEGYPCFEKMVPQLVRVIHPPTGDIHLTKIVGDECIGDGESFMDGSVDGTSISGEAQLEESDDFGGLSQDDDDGEIDWSQATGTVYTDDYIRLDVAGQAVTLRRVLADPDE